MDLLKRTINIAAIGTFELIERQKSCISSL